MREENRPMVVIFPLQNIYMESHARRHGERVEDMREHLRGQISYLLALDAQVCDTIWA